MSSPLALAAPIAGGRRRGASVKTLKRALKKAGLKTTGRKAALTRRAKKAHLKLRGGNANSEQETATPVVAEGSNEGGRRRRHRSRKH